MKEIENNAEEESSAFIQPIYERVTLGTFKKDHDAYDKETNHGRIKSKQNLYNARLKQFRKNK